MAEVEAGVEAGVQTGVEAGVEVVVAILIFLARTAAYNKVLAEGRFNDEQFLNFVLLNLPGRGVCVCVYVYLLQQGKMSSYNQSNNV